MSKTLSSVNSIKILILYVRRAFFACALLSCQLVKCIGMSSSTGNHAVRD